MRRSGQRQGQPFLVPDGPCLVITVTSSKQHCRDLDDRSDSEMPRSVSRGRWGGGTMSSPPAPHPPSTKGRPIVRLSRAFFFPIILSLTLIAHFTLLSTRTRYFYLNLTPQTPSHRQDGFLPLPHRWCRAHCRARHGSRHG